MHILVTGARGQLGTELKTVLESRVPGITEYIDRDELDITDDKAVDTFVRNGDYSHIINCAAYTAVDKAEEEKSLCHAVNTEAVRSLAAVAADTGTKVLHISTDFVFDGNSSRAYTESDKPNPLSHYGATKRMGETQLLGLCPDAIIVRTGWLYSPYGHNFVKTILSHCKPDGRLRVVDDQIGTPTYAADLAAMVADIVLAPQWLPGTYNYSNEGVASWYDFANAIVRLAGFGNSVEVLPIPTTDYPTPAERPAFSVLSKAKIKATYGVKIPHWETSLEKCLKQIGQNE